VQIEVRGDRIRTWLNGELRADFHDSMADEAFIALQVHDVGGEKEPMSVRWRNIQIKALE
jgi:hypothetical protein